MLLTSEIPVYKIDISRLSIGAFMIYYGDWKILTSKSCYYPLLLRYLPKALRALSSS